jgi:hypothetical protein
MKKSSLKNLTVGVSAVSLAASAVPSQAQNTKAAHAWQQPQAQVLPNGDLKWTPQPFQFKAGASVRYIDYAAGDDNNAGTSKTSAWKHHPWDGAATGVARTTRGAHTYVFKRGTIYRGSLKPGDDRGEAGNPIRLTSDPTWGTGEAQIVGSEVVTGWTRGAHPKMPNGGQVWMKEVDFLPRNLWMTAQNGEATRLKLARMNNWNEPDPNDVMSQWPTWENPEWWKDNNKGHTMQVGDKELHLGIDSKNLTGTAEDYVGATVWTEWGIVMGSPYPAKVVGYDPVQKGVAFRGPWTFDKLENIIKGNRYYLEDKPQWLDEPGEFWVENVGGRGRIYLRLPGDADPNKTAVEVGRHINLLDAKQLNHVHISGLTFRFTNTHWDYNDPQWAHPDIQAAVLRVNGAGNDVEVRNNRFEHVNIPLRFNARDGGVMGDIRVNDNVVKWTDHGAFYIDSGNPTGVAKPGSTHKNVEMLRNNLHHIGWRIVSGEHGHAVSVTYPETSHIAGNFLHRIAGWGISVTGGKGGGPEGAEAPLSRHLIHNNRVEDVLLKSNDWGGIETWQGGPFYIYSNIVINPVGFKNWTFNPNDPNSVGSFSHAYYLDGSFKNYLFNNIAQGRNNTQGTKSTNTSALQNVHSFENSFFHNTFYKFVETTRQQDPGAARTRYLSNIIEDSSRVALRNADPSEGRFDPNASHYKQGGNFAYDKLVLHDNVFHNIKGKFGVFEETGVVYSTLDEMRASLQRVNAQVGDIGVMTAKAPLVAPAKGDFRPAPGSDAVGKGSQAWVPWSLYATVGEWNFTRNNVKPAEVMDEHWFMTGNYNKREEYKSTPRYPLQGQNIAAADYTAGSLENWTDGALRLNGQSQYLRVANSTLAPPPAPPATTQKVEKDFATITLPERITAGRAFEVLVEPKAGITGQPRVDLHWLKKESWGGWMAGGNEGVPVGDKGARRFTINPTTTGELDKYSVLVYITPSGTFADKTHDAGIPVERGAETADASKARTVSMDTNNFLIETVVQTRAATGTLVSKADATAGYVLDLVDGKPRLRLTAGGATSTTLAPQSIADGKWHHLVAEVDRAKGVTLYLNGQKVNATTTGAMPAGSLVNGADFLVGGGPGQAGFAGAFDFLRLTRGTLADAHTSIGELYAWQFNGPQHADFAGTSRKTNNAAGALVSR